jgi:hypothetical protein
LEDLSVGRELTDRGIETLVQNRRLKGLILFNSQVTDRCFSSLAKMPRLAELDLVATSVGKTEGFAEISRLKNLTFLDLRRTSVGTFAHCEAIGRLQNLEALTLRGLPVNDEGASAFLNLKKLKMLDIVGTKVSPDTAAKLKRTLPQTDVLSDYDSE